MQQWIATAYCCARNTHVILAAIGMPAPTRPEMLAAHAHWQCDGECERRDS